MAKHKRPQAVRLEALRRRIVLSATVGAFVVALISAAVAAAPLGWRLWSSTERHVLEVASSHARSIEEFTWRIKQAALQVASRTRARELLGYLEQAAGSAPALRQRLREILLEALASAEEIKGITREGRDGAAAISVGRPIPEDVRPVCESDTAVCLSGPVVLRGVHYLVASAPIRIPQGRQIGTDYVLFSVDGLDALLRDRTGLGASGRSWLVVRSPGRPCVYGRLNPRSPECGILPEASPENRMVEDMEGVDWRTPALQSAPQYILAHAPIAASGWAFLVRMDRKEVFADIRRQLMVGTAAVLALTLSGAGAVLIVVRPLAGGLVVRAETLEQEVDARTVALRDAKDRLEHYVEELSHAHAEMERLARTDDLTGVYNRRHVNAEAERIMAGMRRHQREVSLLVFDLDEFKQVNDRHGHEAGDALLKGFAKAVVSQLRVEDVFGRIGGEEFLAVLPETGRGAALEVAERIRDRIAHLRFESEQGPFGATVSIGIASEGAAGTRLADLLRRADAALYEAKRGGRNRVVAH